MTTAPRSFGKYLLEREIARGGMARVHLATLRGLGGFEKRLVVKEILPELASDPRFVAMFVEEAKVLVALSHPNIVPVYELGIVDGTYFLAMEHVQGATLAELVAERRLAPAEAARVGAEVADALAYAHERFDIVHRDVSPRNVMVDTTGHARLLDFGIAARADIGEGDLYGTPGFLSPEQARGERLGPGSDLFSLGCVLMFATQGESPFPAKDLDRLRALDASPVLEEDAESAPLVRIARELLAPRPEARPASAKTVARALASAAAAMERDEGAAASLATRATERSARSETREQPTPEPSGPVTPGRVETLATSQALEALIATAKLRPPIAQPVLGADGEGPRTARIERAASLVAPARSASASAIAWSVVVALVAAALVWNARFELVPFAAVDDVDHGLVSSADIEPLPILPDDAEVPDATTIEGEDAGIDAEATSSPDAGVRSRDAGARGTATLSVRATPWAHVTLDGRSIGDTPVRSASVSVGAHRITLDNPILGRSVETTFRAERGSALDISADLSVEPPTLRGP